MSLPRYLAIFLVLSLCGLTDAVAQVSGDLGVDHTIIGGGRVSGLTFPAAGALCDVFNRQSSATRCYVESNLDSYSNLRALRNGSIDFAIVQSDWVRRAVVGNGLFKKMGPDENLRTIFSLYGEALTILARENSDISNSSELVGRRINAGKKGTYQHLLTEWLLQAQKQDFGEIELVLEKSGMEQGAALCAGLVDALVLITAHPSGHVLNLKSRCPLNIVPISQLAIRVILKNRRELSPITIPNSYYTDKESVTKSFGLRAVLVANARIDDSIVDYMVRSVFGSLDMLKAQHPVFESLTADTMAQDAAGAPLHKGAVSFFKERGWR